MTLLLLVAAYAVYVFNDLWLAYWVGEPDDLEDSENLRFAYVYMGGTIAHVCLIIAVSVVVTNGCVRASNTLHADCLQKLLHAPVQFYDATPSGRILSRFSSDFSVVDLQLPGRIDNFLQLLANVVATVGIVCYLVPLLSPVIVVGGILLWWQIRIVEVMNREAKRTVGPKGRVHAPISLG